MKRKKLSKSEEAALLDFAFSHSHALCLRGNGWKENQASSDYLLAFGADEIISADSGTSNLTTNYRNDQYWFGHFEYDLKNQLEALESNNPDRVNFPTTQFFRPRFMVQKSGDSFELLKSTDSANNFWDSLTEIQPREHSLEQPIKLNAKLSYTNYLEALARIQAHIQRGNIYQVNFCQEFFAEDVSIDPVRLFELLIERMANPFSALYRCGNHYALSLSPEAFLSKEGDKLLSQPMKGTAPRSGCEEQDEAFREMLQNSEKDRRENVMITDLVRNDLSHFAAKGSVVVEELCQVKTYPNVHQMISKVACVLRPEVNGMEAILKAFPMGSMTGAPKIRAMEIIEQLEESKRGLYSGAIGCFHDNGDFEFNVVIRTLLYNQKTGYLSCHAGGGITALSSPVAEYEECLVKLEPIKRCLEEVHTSVALSLPLSGA